MKIFLKKNYYLIFGIYIFAIISRLISLYYFGEKSLTEEWSILFHNFKNFGVIGINVFNGSEVVMKIASSDEKLLPSAYMPPMYLFFIIFLDIFATSNHLVLTIQIFQIILSIISGIIFFKLLKKFFSKNVCLFGTFLFLLFPINIYANSQISSITLQVFLLVTFFYLIFEVIEKKNLKSILFFSIISSALLLTRGEFLLILAISYFFIFFNLKKIKLVFLSFLISLILISPYVLRNYKHFEVITITKSSGFNLWKGNNLFTKPQGNQDLYQAKMIEKINKIKPDSKYEIKKDRIYFEEAINNILSTPGYFLKLYLKKINSFLFFDSDSTIKFSNNKFYIVPKILISILSFFGIFFIGLKKNILHYFTIIYLFNIFFFSIFFILPRYSLALLPIQIILSCVFLDFINRKLSKTKNIYL